MNHVIAGKPGGGKGLFSMILVNEDIVKGCRPVITDLAVEKLPWCSGWEPRRGYINYLQEKYSKTFEMEERLFRLKPAAMTNGFLYRALNRMQVERLGAAHLVGYREVTPLDDVLEDSEWQFHKDYKLYIADHESHADKRGRKVVDAYDTRLALASGAHLLLKDEAWIAYPARGWSNTGEGILYYMSMVRRFGDDFWLCSQRFADCDSILVDRCQDFYTATNHGKLRFGPFKQPGIFNVSVYDQRPTPSSEPMSRKPFMLDRKGLAQCYDTSGGVGVSGRVMADLGRKTKGLPLWVLPVIGILVVVLAWKGLSFGMGAVRSILAPKKKPVVATAVTVTNQPVAVEKVSVGVSADVQKKGPFIEKSAPEIFCVGFSLLGKPQAFLSDGTIVEPPELELIARTYVQVEGKKIKLANIRPGVATPPAPTERVAASPAPLQGFDYAEPVQSRSSTVDVTVIGERRRQRNPPIGGMSQGR